MFFLLYTYRKIIDMKTHHIILTIGILVALMPFAGFPSMWKTVFYAAGGVVVAALSVMELKKSEANEGDALYVDSADNVEEGQ